MRRRLDVAAALLHRPPVLFLDEPTTGLDPESRFALWDSVRELSRSGATVLLTTQYLEEADALADRVVILAAGRVADTGTPAELKARVGSVVFRLGFGGEAAAEAARAVLAAAGYRPERDGADVQVRLGRRIRRAHRDAARPGRPRARPGVGRGTRTDPGRRVPFSYPGGPMMSAFADILDVAGRNLRTLFRTPQALIFATIQPVIFVLLFRYAFGGAIRVPGVNYVDYLMPGIFAQSVAFGAVGTAVGLSADLRSGILVRFRTLPMARIAVLGGRTLADLARNVVVVVVMIGVGFAAGFRSANGAPGLLAALALVVVFAYAVSWGFAALGLRVSDPEAAQAAGVPVVFLLVFTSAAFVPASAMPGWLQAFGTHQPVDALVSAERAP